MLQQNDIKMYFVTLHALLWVWGGAALAGTSSYPTDLSVSLLVATPGYSFTVEPPQRLAQVYLPNSDGRLGVGASYKGYGGSVTWAGPTTAEDERARGRTKTTDYSFAFYWQEIAIDLFYQNYSGFYVKGSEDPSGIAIKFPDANAFHAGAQLYYVFRPERYNMSSAFDQTVKQSDSGGSWVLYGYGNSFKIETGSVSNAQADPAVYPTFLAESANVGAGGGYGYSARWGGWYLSGQLLVGVGYQARKYQQNSINESGTGTGSKYTVHLWFGWTGEKNCFGLTSMADGINFPEGAAVPMKAEATQGRLFYLYRF